MAARRIVHVIGTLEMGGGSTHLLLPRLAPYGFESLVIAGRDGPAGDRLRAVGIPVSMVGAMGLTAPCGWPATMTSTSSGAPVFSSRLRSRAGFAPRPRSMTSRLSCIRGQWSSPTTWSSGCWCRRRWSGPITSHITVISQAGREDVRRMFGIAADRITVVPPGMAPRFHPRPSESARAYVAAVFGLTVPYVLVVGTLEPRKDLITLIRALRLLPAVRAGATMVVVSAGGWKNSALRAEAALLVADRAVRFPGYVPDADLPWLYAAAEALPFPALYEGFGIPVIEAMACGTPVIASDIPVLREVAGDAAWLVPAADPASWADALACLLRGRSCRGPLVERGLRRAQQFTFDVSARRMLDLWGGLAR